MRQPAELKRLDASRHQFLDRHRAAGRRSHVAGPDDTGIPDLHDVEPKHEPRLRLGRGQHEVGDVAGLVERDPHICTVQRVAIALVAVIRRHRGAQHGPPACVGPVAVPGAGGPKDVRQQGGAQPIRRAHVQHVRRPGDLPRGVRELLDARCCAAPHPGAGRHRLGHTAAVVNRHIPRDGLWQAHPALDGHVRGDRRPRTQWARPRGVHGAAVGERPCVAQPLDRFQVLVTGLARSLLGSVGLTGAEHEQPAGAGSQPQDGDDPRQRGPRPGSRTTRLDERRPGAPPPASAASGPLVTQDSTCRGRTRPYCTA